MNAHEMFHNADDEPLDDLFAEVMDLVGLPGDEPLTDDELQVVMRRIGPVAADGVSCTADGPATVSCLNVEPCGTLELSRVLTGLFDVDSSHATLQGMSPSIEGVTIVDSWRGDAESAMIRVEADAYAATVRRAAQQDAARIRAEAEAYQDAALRQAARIQAQANQRRDRIIADAHAEADRIIAQARAAWPGRKDGWTNVIDSWVSPDDAPCLLITSDSQKVLAFPTGAGKTTAALYLLWGIDHQAAGTKRMLLDGCVHDRLAICDESAESCVSQLAGHGRGAAPPPLYGLHDLIDAVCETTRAVHSGNQCSALANESTLGAIGTGAMHDVRELARQGVLAIHVLNVSDPDRRLLRVKAVELVYRVVFDRLTRRLESNREHHACASSSHRLEPTCLDRFYDDVGAAVEDLFRNAKQRIFNLVGWMAKRLNASTIDAYRQRRGRRGAPQRPRPPGWLVKRLGNDAWLTELAVEILMRVGEPAAAGMQPWPLEEWAQRRRLATGEVQGSDVRAVLRDVDRVLREMRVKPQWYEDYIERPLGHKPMPMLAGCGRGSSVVEPLSEILTEHNEVDDPRHALAAHAWLTDPQPGHGVSGVMPPPGTLTAHERDMLPSTVSERETDGQVPTFRQVATTVAERLRIVGTERQTLTKDLVRRYISGESIRALAASTGRSYGFIHRVLTESGVQLRQRGGSRRRKRS